MFTSRFGLFAAFALATVAGCGRSTPDAANDPAPEAAPPPAVAVAPVAYSRLPEPAPPAKPTAPAVEPTPKPPAPVVQPSPKPATTSGVEYARDVQPIFAKHCVSCHGPDKQRAGLRLDTAAAVREGGNSGEAVLPGKSADSLLVHALAGSNDVALMPPADPRPTAAEVAVIQGWIDQGAVGPAAESGTAKTTVAKSDHWSFQPVRRPEPPAVRDAGRVRNPIDNFVTARLEKEGLAPAAEADKVTLIRRVALDLTGLPPTPAEVDKFVADKSPDAYDKLVTRLLASPHYGERWGRHWLDLARYADSNGYSIDGPRSIWPYRDWVIKAVGRDMPFDQFTVEQLAGDLLPNATVEQKVATGFHRNTGINQEGGVDPEQFRVEAVVDRVNTTGVVWLGLTVGCAQCHDHKYDPVSQREYYNLFAFLNNQDEPNLTLPGMLPEAVAKLLPTKGKGKPPAAVTTMVLAERKTPRDTHVFLGGDFTRKGVKVGRGTPAVLPPLPKSETPTRLELARWLVDPANPLTPRVVMNRVWGQYFGIGLVETENDFGTQGEKPTHPELLDWLAAEFVKQKWSMKAMHRLIVSSATYRQSSGTRPDAEAVDSRNRLLARQARLRLDAEIVRDAALTASGLLTRTVGGPGVFPPQPEGVSRLTQVSRAWTPAVGPDRYRRGMYTYFWRAAPHPALTVFDAPDAGTACTRRTRSNTPLQALTLLNDQGFYEYAHGLAGRILEDGGDAAVDRLAYAFRLCVARTPAEGELARLQTLLDKQKAYYAKNPAEPARVFAGGGPAGATLAAADFPPAEKAAWVAVARVLLNLDETITRE